MKEYKPGLEKLLQNRPKILIVRLSSIGDVLQASTVAQALKKAWPQARISWAVEGKSKDVIEGNSALDQVFVWLRREWYNEARKSGDYWTLLRRTWRFFRQIREQKFDITINLHGIARSELVVFASGAPYRICMANPPERCFYSNIQTPGREFSVRYGYKRYLSVLRHFGCETDSPQMQITLSAADKAFARCFMRKHNLWPQRFIVFNPSTAADIKCWPLENFARLGDRLIDEFKLPIVIFGAASDKHRAQIIAGQMNRPVIDATGTMTLKELGAVTEEAGVFISGDTGPLFIAYALRAPVIALFGPTIADELYMPYKNSISFQAAGNYLQNITVEEVFQAARSILGSAAHSHLL